MPQELTAAPTWDSMSPGEKLAWLLEQALDCKRHILTIPLPDQDDYSAEAIRMRALILDAADSTIEQTIRLRTNQLAQAPSSDIGEAIEERRQKAQEQIKRMLEEERAESNYLNSGKPH